MIERGTAIAVGLLLLIIPLMAYDSTGGKVNQDIGFEVSKEIVITNSSSGSFIGEAPHSSAGFHLAKAGDLNGDSIQDIIIGAPYMGDGTNYYIGKVYVVFGKAGGFEDNFNLSSSDASFIGEARYNYAGLSYCGDTDLNGDGLDDIVIGSYGYQEGYYYLGRVYIIFGKAEGWTTNVSLADADAIITGAESVRYLGRSISSAGDVNSDGFGDVVIGSSNDEAFLLMGRSSGWTRTMTSDDAGTKFTAEQVGQMFGYAVAGGGDVNNDGYDDIMIGAQRNHEAGSSAGQTYLFLGRENGFDSEVSADSADASFHGEGPLNMSGSDIYLGGDVNRDGYDDMIIASSGYNQYLGKVHLVLGHSSDWSMDTSLLDADASWIGELDGYYTGSHISMVSDISSNGYDDILIGAPYYQKDGYSYGKVYVIPGRSSGWERNISISGAPMSFIDETPGNSFGYSFADFGDVDGNGAPDILIGAYRNNEGGLTAGKVHILESYRNYDPEEIYSIRIFSRPDYLTSSEYVDRTEMIYIQITGADGNFSHLDSTTVNITMDWDQSKVHTIPLRETGMDSGVYRGSYIVPLTSKYLGNITVRSTVDRSKSDRITVHTPVLMMPLEDNGEALEDNEYKERYWNFGYAEDVQWKLDTDAEWLEFYPSTGSLYGIPDNDLIGNYHMSLSLTDGSGHTDIREFDIKVKNKDPELINEDILRAVQDEYYYVDYSSNEDYSPKVSWHFHSNASWLTLNENTGELFGTPTNYDVGSYYVRIWVEDGNGGKGMSEFTLTVDNLNDAPEITTTDIVEIDQDSYYRRDYDVKDIDTGDSHFWSLETDASWLSIDRDTGVLAGSPGPRDVGVFNVKVTVTDKGGMTDIHVFKLTVNDLNDPPMFSVVPQSGEIPHGEPFTFQVWAVDPDGSSILTYSIKTSPQSDMTIDPESGDVRWTASVNIFDREPYKLRVTITVTDGEFRTNHEFELQVLPSAPPESVLLGPEDGAKVSLKNTLLTWSGSDPEGDVLSYNVYIGETKAFVEAMKDSVLYLEKYSGTEAGLEGLKTGKTYYWTVAPYDGCSLGICSSSVRSFRLNNPPTMKDVEFQELKAGTELKLLLKG
ncbi:MAG: putative Ig domain-containing protein, partial [Thermoplasmatota archaeon]